MVAESKEAGGGVRYGSRMASTCLETMGLMRYGREPVSRRATQGEKEVAAGAAVEVNSRCERLVVDGNNAVGEAWSHFRQWGRVGRWGGNVEDFVGVIQWSRKMVMRKLGRAADGVDLVDSAGGKVRW